MSRKSKLLSLVMALLMALSACVPIVFAEDAAAPEAIPAGYKQEPVAQNSRCNLYLNEDNLAIILQSKATGALMYSTVKDPENHKGQGSWPGFYQSGIVLEYIENLKASPAQANFLDYKKGTDYDISYEYLADGFTAHVDYKKIGISFDMTLTMDEAGIHLFVPQDSFKETKDAPYLIVLNDKGEEERIDLTYYAGTKKENAYVLVTDAGEKYDLPTATLVAPKGKTGLTLLTTDGATQVTVPLSDKDLEKLAGAIPSVNVTDAKGAAVALAADKVVSFETMEYLTATDVKGNAVRCLTQNVVEDSSISYTTAGLYLYPFLGYSYLGEDEGYMVIPDGQGAIIKLENNEGRYKSPFTKQVYGTNIGVDDTVNSEFGVASENVIMPIFGMVHTDSRIGFLGVIEEGDLAANIMAYPNGAGNLNFDWTCAKYTYRMVFNQPMGMNGSAAAGVVPTRTEKPRNFDIRQHFLLTEGDQASYAGLAVAYREYLIGKGVFANAEHSPFDVQLDFLGLERENYVFGKQDVVMTSFDQVQEMLKELKASGVEQMSVVLRGWQSGGLTGGVPMEGYDPASSLGGKNGLKALKDYAAAEGIDLALEADVLSLNAETHPSLTYSAFKKITSATWKKPTFGKVYSTLQYLTPTVSQEMAAKLVDETVDNGITGIAFTGITQLLADYYYKGAYHDAREMADIYTDILEDAGEKLEVTLTSPNAYLWPCADVLTDLPIAGSDYTYVDAEIPFLAIALSGQITTYAEYVNFQANTQAFFLHLAEQGTRPAFLLTMEDPIELKNTNSSGIYSSKYELYAEMIKTWYTDLSALYDTVGAQGKIMDHVRQGDMVCVTWDNGTKVYLNFGHQEGTMDGVTLPELDWKVVSGNGN